MIRASIARLRRLARRDAAPTGPAEPAEPASRAVSDTDATAGFETRRDSARQAERDARPAEAEAMWRALALEFPDRAEPARRAAQLAVKRARRHLADGQTDAAAEILSALSPKAAESLDALLARGDLAGATGDTALQETLLQSALERFPDKVEPYRAWIRAADRSGRVETALGTAHDMAARFPDRDEGWRAIARLERKAGDAAAAERALRSGQSQAGGWRLSQELARLLLRAGRAPEALAEARKAHADRPLDPDIAGLLAQALFQTDGEAAAFAVLDPVAAATPDTVETLQEMARLQVMAGRDRAARDTIARLTRLAPRATATLRLRVWAQARHRAPSVARRLWQAHDLGAGFPALSGDIAALTHRAGDLDPARPLLRLSLVQRNARLRLPYFLEYYRGLGVERFVVVDNGSDDGSQAYLAAQPDVCLFTTEASFAAAAAGMRWINGLMDLCPDDHWWLHADIDEFLVLPGQAVSLPARIAALEAEGAEILPAYMLDMFPAQAADGEAYLEGQDPLSVSPWFDQTYRFSGAIEPPFVAVDGGSRDRFTARGSESRPLLTKTALTRRVRFVNSHGTTPGRPAAMRGAFLHFKFIGPFRAEIRSEVGRKEHYNGAAQYALLNTGLSRLGADASWVGPASRRYDGAGQLERAGLITEYPPN